MTSPPKRSARRIPNSVFPAAVGPVTITTEIGFVEVSGDRVMVFLLTRGVPAAA